MLVAPFSGFACASQGDTATASNPGAYTPPPFVDAGHVTVVRVDDEPPGTNCPTGGVAIKTGIDLNDNGVLDDDEVTSTKYVCNSATPDGGTPVDPLVTQQPEPAGPHCEYGGIAVSVGLDLNGDGILEPNEVTSTTYICNVAQAGDGGAPPLPLVNVVPEPAGLNCPNGGQAIQTGVDLNGDRKLEPNEVTSTAYVCSQSGTGGMLQGSYVIKNSVDVAILSLFSGITGNLTFDCPGLTSISLPTITMIGGSLGAGPQSSAPDLVTLDLPALVNVGDVDVDGGSPYAGQAGPSWAALETLALPLLASATTGVTIQNTSLTSIQLPVLTSAPKIVIGNFATLDLPQIQMLDSLDIYCYGPCGFASLPKLMSVGDLSMSIGGVLTAPQLAAVFGNLSIQTQANVDLSALKTIAGDLSFSEVAADITLPALAAVGGNATIQTASSGQTVSFPALASIGGYLGVYGNSPPIGVSFPALTSLAGTLEITTSGAFQAPLLATLQSDAWLRATAVNLDGLLTVTGATVRIGTETNDFYPFSPTSLSLPALQTITGGYGVAISVDGAFAAPLLSSVQLTPVVPSPPTYSTSSFAISRVTSINLDSLQTVGSGWSTPLGLATGATSLQFPALTTAWIYVGYEYISSSTLECSNDPSIGNPLLTQITAPNLMNGGIVFNYDPVFPKCRADQLSMQLGQMPEEICPLAAGPCP